MDPVLAPFMLLFLGTLGLDLGLFDNSDDDDDAAPTATAAPDATPAAPSDVATPGDFDASLYTEVVNGTDGADDLSTEGRTALAWFLGDGNDSLDGSLGNDYVEGGAGDDSMNLRDGRDLAYGGDGDDQIDAGIGFDTVFGGAGADTLTGNGGEDVVYGDEGDDELRGGTGADLLFGGAGNDTIYGLSPGLSTEVGSTSIDGVDSLSGGDGDDRLILGPGDIGHGGAGADTFVVDYARPDITTPSQINDYTTEDRIEVEYTPQFDISGAEVLPIITLSLNAANTGSLLMFNGATIADVIGGQALIPGQIILMPVLR